MKVLSVAIPCYNSAAYMSRAIETLLTGGEDMEILIINDGSKDETAKIADDYANIYPSIIKAIHQPNKGHGGAVNTGIENASGIFFKVVDSDDWVNEEALQTILESLKEILQKGEMVDMVVSNFVYEKQGVERKKVMRYANAFPEKKIFGWNDIDNFNIGQYLLMHSVIYRTKFIRDCNLKLPEHTFYVDNIFIYHPLQYVKNMYYIDVNFYRYFIGREDQSVNENVMIGRIEQQIRVTKLMIEDTDVMKIKEKKLRNYMINYLSIMMTVSSILMIKSGTEENLIKKKELWEYLRQVDKTLYRKIRYCLLGQSVNLLGKPGRKLSIWGYKISRKIYGFN